MRIYRRRQGQLIRYNNDKTLRAKKLNIDPDELTQRFVRGDESRTMEGSGLGL